MEGENNKMTNAATASLSGGRIKVILAAITFCLFVLGFSMFKLLPMQAAIQGYLT